MLFSGCVMRVGLSKVVKNIQTWVMGHPPTPPHTHTSFGEGQNPISKKRIVTQKKLHPNSRLIWEFNRPEHPEKIKAL